MTDLLMDGCIYLVVKKNNKLLLRALGIMWFTLCGLLHELGGLHITHPNSVGS